MLGSLEGLNEVTVASGRSVVSLGRSLGDSPRSQGGSGSYSGLERVCMRLERACMGPEKVCLGPEVVWGAKGNHLGGSGLKDLGRSVNSSHMLLRLKGLLRPKRGPLRVTITS